MNYPNIKVYLNNNPKCSAKLENIAKKEVWDMENIPFIRVFGSGFDNGNKLIKVIVNNRILEEDEIEIDNNYFDLKIELEKPLKNPKKVEVIIDKKEYEIPIILRKLTGKVKYANGDYVKKPVISVTGEDSLVVGDKLGNFEISIHGNKDSIGVFEKNYTKKTLESWLYNINILEDKHLDITIDKMEVYGIHMWKGQNSDYIHFIPMSLTKAREAMKKDYDNELDLLKNNPWPKLNRKNLKVFANDKEIDILSFKEVSDFLANVDDKTYTRPGYVLSIPKGYEGKLIKLVIEDKYLIDDKEIFEMGEGYYFW
ncbi:MAG: hypothetical protein FH751_13345 [Firmicutes bacterium]|nr:hypothetical protein [Bacillota bacterium]